ncbi:MAG TPA: alpha-2-macroglobulin family protein, partial [Pyrinomonadaceae bacterium]|nr:alpha-2-macroglobulin family protein [Pyrinomonadaceae bacterium]
YLSFSAHDREGRTGTEDETIWLYSSQPVIRIETEKTIYRAGENIRARISSSEKDLKIFVDVVSDNRVVATETLRLRGGSAGLELPYRPEFRNRVMLSAYSTDIPDSDYDDYPSGTRTVIFPRNRELKFDVRMSRASYQPGEEATAGVRVRNASGRSVESALGVVVFDKAVEERARTEQDFSSSYGFSSYFYQFWYGLESVGGVSARDIEQINPARPLPEGLETAAELLLQREYEDYQPNFFGASFGSTNQSQVFGALAAAELKATGDALTAHKDKTAQHPTNEADLRRILAIAGIALGDLRDPWGKPYQFVFSVERARDVLSFRSAGADKQPGTSDDWEARRLTWTYFDPISETMSRALREYHKRNGNFIRDYATLRSELARLNFDLDNLRDRWGKPYGFSFGVNGTYYILNVVSGGPDGRLVSTDVNYNTTDDFVIWTEGMDYFADTRPLIDAALAAYLKATGAFPRDEAALAETFRRVQLQPANLKDPWGHPYYAAFRTESRYADRVQVERGNANALSPGAQQRTTLTPVTRQLFFITLRSAGADGLTGTSDDFNVAEFSHIVSDQSAQDKQPVAATVALTFNGSTGAIGGSVLDPSGAAVAAATVKATHQQQAGREFATTTDDEGKYLLHNLPAGLYTVRVDAPGFSSTVVMDVQVQASTLATVNLTLAIGSVQETVTVSGSTVAVQTTMSALQTNVTKQSIELLGRGATAQKSPISTPRLRKDFPETLYWQPAVETDRQGRTNLSFKLADNITTWKMSIIGSTETGELGTVEQEIRAFQPFFVEHDPPRVLTEGDEISLPVVLRNYLDRAQPVALDIKPEDWFTLLSPAHKQVNAAAGDATRETFDFRAVASVKEGLQRITAIGADASDQIEKPVHVHPDGEEVADTATQILRAASVLEVNLPATAIQRSARAELKIYPNLMAHAIEGVEAIMSRPYGCAEQTISSTYPSLLVLRHYRHAESDAATHAPPIAAKAARYVRQGYERLLSYRSESGGFSYWGRGEPDLALTAYAVRFLTDAREFTSVDETVLTKAREWLVSQQRADGSWAAYEYEKTSNGRRTAMLTAYVARILAMQQPGGLQPDPQVKIQTSQIKTQAAPTAATSPATPLQRALAYLAPRTEEIDEPYLIASYALAAIDGGASPDLVARATTRLRALARDEAGMAYWSLETNTPFYGWGQAGRIETTALAVQALSKASGKDESGRVKDEESVEATAAPASTPSALAAKTARLSSGELVDRGLLFLLKNKDRYGVWLSTQATVNVLDALDALSPKRLAGAQRNQAANTTSLTDTSAGQQAEVFVNGQSAGMVALPAAHEPANPVSLDLSRFLAPGSNRVEIKRASDGATLVATAQLVTTYYRSWAHADASGTHAKPEETRALRLTVNFDRTAAATGDTVTCRVEAERIGHRGYGMLLAEVGLPPGADVDRASLERAMQESGWEFSHYDVLPDRLVAYLWPRAGGTKFQFTFRPRFGLKAQSAPSLVYDYYNPEAHATLAPTKFIVNEKPAASPAQAGRE